MHPVSFDRVGFFLKEEPAFLASGEMHYFRVPKADWAQRLRLLKEAGGNCVATYVPWLIHEPAEGDIRFSDIPERDLAGFLAQVRAAGLCAIVRPGPYCYSELVNGGLPTWLLRDYPQILARDASQKTFNPFGVSYTHPLFLEKARRFYRAFADQVRPFIEDGTIAMVQLDNELMGVHVWFGSIDHNAQAFGLGGPDGRYAQYLKRKYSDIALLNEAYGTSAKTHAEASSLPFDGGGQAEARRRRDFALCYLESAADYLALLDSWLTEDGIDVPCCHNSGNPDMNALFETSAQRMGGGFLLGSDHYYTLNQTWAQTSPGPLYALKSFLSCETLRLLGFPPTVLELPGGSPADTPPILPEDLSACYLMNLAFGMKGFNVYIFTGGPNVAGTGETCDIYDYAAPVLADGTKNRTYDVLRDFSNYLAEHPALSRSEALASVQVGIEWETLCCALYDWPNAPVSAAKAKEFLLRGVLYALFCGKYTPKIVNLAEKIDPSLPLIAVTPSMMSPAAQQNMIEFASQGGQALIAPAMPLWDWDLNPQTALSTALGGANTKLAERSGKSFWGLGERTYQLDGRWTLDHLPESAQVFLTDELTEAPLGAAFPIGAGCVRAVSASWTLQTFGQARLLERILEEMGAKPTLTFSNRNIWGMARRTPDGAVTVFAMNLYSSPQTTDATVYVDGRELTLGSIALKAMEVRLVKAK